MRHNHPPILPGTKRNQLTIVRQDGVVTDGKATRRRMLLVLCDCGTETRVRSQAFFSDKVRSCGCLVSKPTHGLTHHRLYSCWLSMVRRCTVPAHPQYPNYGARGIAVCQRWLESPAGFIADMEPSYQEGLTIERIDNNGNYEPGNCRWAPNVEQQRNRRNNFNLTFNGKTKTISEWSRIAGLDRSSIKDRLDRGWSIERALTTPRMDNAR
jgi:hypothetical protein